MNAMRVFRNDDEGINHDRVGDRMEMVHADSGVASCCVIRMS